MIFLDTSVLVAVFLEDHEHHERSFSVFSSATIKTACCGAHSLAEVYATITRLPGKHRGSGEQVMLFVEEIQQRLTVIALDPSEYVSTIREASVTGIVGGMLYDALLVASARKAHVEILYTWNVQHFRRVGADISKRVRNP